MSRVRGARNISNLLKKLPQAVSDEMVVEMNVTGREIASVMRGRTPFRTGALKAGISYKVFPKSLKLKVGLLGTKAGRSSLFYGRILDLGRKAQTVQVTRRSPTGTVSSYMLHVSALAPRRFVSGRYVYSELRTKMTSNLRDIWDRALTRAAIGGRID